MITTSPRLVNFRTGNPRRTVPRLHGVRHSHGAAIIMAMLIMALSTVIISGLFWRQNVTVRSIENRLALSQTRWIERAATDWARVILRQDLNISVVDHLGEIWALPVAETKMDETVTAGAKIDNGSTNASLSGQIIDMQGRFNLNNLVQNGIPNPVEIESFGQLLTIISLPKGLADALVEHLISISKKPAAAAAEPNSSKSNGASGFALKRTADLAQIKGFDPRVISVLDPFVVILPVPSKINVNTASAEVIAARVAGLDLAAARSLVVQREKAFFPSIAKAASLLNLSQGLPDALWSVSSSYFLVRGVVKFERVESRSDTLLERKPDKTIEVIWQDRY